MLECLGFRDKCLGVCAKSLVFRVKGFKEFYMLHDLGKAPGLPQTIDNFKNPSV